MRNRQTKERIKLPMPTKSMFCHRHTTTFSMVFTRMTMIGKVRNMNQSETRNDRLTASKCIIVSNTWTRRGAHPAGMPPNVSGCLKG